MRNDPNSQIIKVTFKSDSRYEISFILRITAKADITGVSEFQKFWKFVAEWSLKKRLPSDPSACVQSLDPFVAFSNIHDNERVDGPYDDPGSSFYKLLYDLLAYTNSYPKLWKIGYDYK